MDKRRTILLSLALGLITLVLYWPATGFEFVCFDDHLYIQDNPSVRQGLCLASLKWAWTTNEANYWIPLTWISHIVDYSLFGLFAGGHHLTSIVLHSLNTVLLFLLLKSLTRSLWPSLLVAALFGWHPLHVESAAWVAERKDILSTLFLLLTIWAYSRYVERPTIRRYTLALAAFALGLMCKPMLVTLPFLLLLLDYWPLSRWSAPSESSDRSRALRASFRLLVEKIPFFVLAFAAGIVTLLEERSGGAIKDFQEVSGWMRVLNAPLACVRYVGKTICPVNLSVFYPLPSELPVVAGFSSALALALVSYLIFRRRSQYPWLIVGWLWFLGTLFPVLGLVQIGSHAMADRYAYVSAIGLFVMFAWSLHCWVRGRPSARAWGLGIATVPLLVCVWLTPIQLAYWQDSIALFTHALSVTKNNAVAHNNLGVGLANAGKTAGAISHYAEALRIKPDYVFAHYNLGVELAAAGKLDQAAFHFSEALKYNPRSEILHNNIGVILARQGKPEAAMAHFKQAIQINPAYPKPYLNYGAALQNLGLAGQAVTNYTKALELDPAWPEALDKLAFMLATCPETNWHNSSQAIRLAERANEITGRELPAYLATLALTYAAAGEFSNAVFTAEQARQKAQVKGLQKLAGKLEADLQFYRTGRNPPTDWKDPAADGVQH
jgi:tetratricopeptide (TPR) repeat protein